MTRPAAVTLLLLATACVPNHGPLMAPFQDCLSCHDGNSARKWTAAGTWAKGARVTITDAAGKSFTLRGNDVGNFYTAEPLAFPIRMSVDGSTMAEATSYGGCNVCHRASTVTVGPLMAPGSDCLACHGPSGMATAKFSAAGTWRQGAGTSVSVGGYTTTTNSVGNFIFCAGGNPCSFQGSVYGTVAPIGGWPAPASVGGQAMENGAPYGGCNRCHGLGGNAGGD